MVYGVRMNSATLAVSVDNRIPFLFVWHVNRRSLELLKCDLQRASIH